MFVFILLLLAHAVFAADIETPFTQQFTIPVNTAQESVLACPTLENGVTGKLKRVAADWHVEGLNRALVLGADPNNPLVFISGKWRKGHEYHVMLWNGSHQSNYPRDVIVTLNITCSYPQ